MSLVGSEKSKGDSSPVSPPTELEQTQQGADHVHAPPTFAGMSGQKLSTAVSIVATTGFLLFGYDRKFSNRPYTSDHCSLALQRV